MSKTVRSLYIFTLLKHCSRLYKSAICLCPKVSCCSKYCSKISPRRHHKAQRALFVFEYGRDACASRWAERRRTVNSLCFMCCRVPSSANFLCLYSARSAKHQFFTAKRVSTPISLNFLFHYLMNRLEL